MKIFKILSSTLGIKFRSFFVLDGESRFAKHKNRVLHLVFSIHRLQDVHDFSKTSWIIL